jgi:uncharacterized membrane protein YebE (DUF533 family)
MQREYFYFNNIGEQTMKKILVTLALVAAFGATAIAQPPAKGQKIEKRLAKQEIRIQKAVQKGKITPEEASRLQAGAVKIQNDVNAAKSDGTITKDERTQIKQALKERREEIKALKHN